MSVMLTSYFKIAMRNILRHKGYSLINIIGLAIGMACCFVIILWVQDELSYDDFHRHRQSLYRILSDSQHWEGYWGTPAPLAPAITGGIPGVAEAARLAEHTRLVFKKGDEIFYESGGLLVDASFFDMLTFPFIAGDPQTAFPNPQSIVLTRKLAHKYFGDANPLGQVIQVDGREMTVTGVLADIPETSHLQFNYLRSFEFIREFTGWGTDWGTFNFATYLRLEPGADAGTVGRHITALAAEHNCPQVTQDGAEFYLQPLSQIHLDGRILYSYGAVTDAQYLSLMAGIAALILVIACINFMNLSTARSTGRAREVGVRKVIGSTRGKLVGQFLGESLITAAIACGVALLLTELLLPFFNGLFEKSLAIEYASPGMWLNLAAVVVVVGLGAGSYPALFLSSFDPAIVLSGRRAAKGGGGLLRKILVVAQFSLSVGLIVTTLVVYMQIRHMSNAELGFSSANIVYLPLKGSAAESFPAIKEELLADPNITAVAAKNYLGTRIIPLANIYRERQSPDEGLSMVVTSVDFDYLDLMGFTILEGRNFSREFVSDTAAAFVLNEEAVRRAGIDNPVGKVITAGGKSGTIIGVINDARFRSLRHPVAPLVMDVASDVSGWKEYGVMLIKIDGRHTSQAVGSLESLWRRANPEVPFEYHFLDQTYEEMYRRERRLGLIFNSATALAVIICCLGLFGLSSFTAEQRTREVGIRKSMGASEISLVGMFIREYLWLVALANIVAWPAAWFATGRWLDGYADRVDVGWSVFIISGVLALLIAVATVAGQAVRAARTNPVEAMKYE